MAALPALTTLIFAALLGGAAVSDLRRRTIPNRITVAGLAAALLISALPGGLTPAGALLGLGVAFLVAFPLFALGAFGGGDAKLLLVVGAFMGPKSFFLALLFTIFAGGALALYTAAKTGLLLETFRNLGSLSLYLVTFGSRGRSRTIATPGAVTVPYGLAIAVGSILAWMSV